MKYPYLCDEQRLHYLELLSERFKLAPAYPNSKVPIGENWNNPLPFQRFNKNDFIGNNAVILTGKLSDVLVVDVDNMELFDFMKKRLKVSIPKTFTVKSGKRGYHYYFNYPKDGRTYTTKLKEIFGIELIGDGKCVVSPKSIHPETFNSYEVTENFRPVDPPQWLINLYWDDRAALKKVIIEKDKRISSNIRELIEQKTPIGKRSDVMWEVLCSLVKEFSEEQIFYIFYTYPVGEKFISVGNTKIEWLSKQIEKAKAHVSNEQGTVEINETEEDEYYNSIINNIDVEFGAKFIHSEPPKVDPIIEGLLPYKGNLVIIGPPGIGKSIFTLNLSMYVGNPPANGIFDLLNVPKAIKSVFLQSENDQQTLWDRVRKITSADNDMLKGYQNVFIPGFNGRVRCIGFDFNSKHFRKLLMTLKHKTDAQMLIIDPAISFLGAEENNNTEIRKSLDALISVTTDLDMSVILVHHPGKAGNMGVYTGRGASAIADWASNLMTLNYSSHGNVKCIKVTVEKSRTSSVIDPFYVMLDENLIFKKYDPYGPLISTVIQVLMQNGATINTQAEFIKQIRLYDDKISVSSAKQAIEEAVNQKLISTMDGKRNSKTFTIR